MTENPPEPAVPHVDFDVHTGDSLGHDDRQATGDDDRSSASADDVVQEQS